MKQPSQQNACPKAVSLRKTLLGKNEGCVFSGYRYKKTHHHTAHKIHIYKILRIKTRDLIATTTFDTFNSFPGKK